MELKKVMKQIKTDDKCQVMIRYGNRKGQICNRNCVWGVNVCGMHNNK